MASSQGDHGSQPVSPAEVRDKTVRARPWLRLLIILVMCAAAIYWAGRTVWENNHPSMALARGLRSGDPAQRLAAISAASELDAAESAAAIQPLIEALGDKDAGVRAAAAQALGVVGVSVLSSP